MDARPIGVFDSGLGGLTAVKRLYELLPGEDIVYLGDTGRVPYGSRSRDTIVKYARQDAAFLLGFDIKAMVIACNTVSSSAYPELCDAVTVPLYEVVRTPAISAVNFTKNGRIGVIGTQATVRSRAYEKAILAIRPDADVYSAACPLFVPLVENGRTEPSDIVAMTLAKEYLAPLRAAGVDTLILGCTHYPLLRGVIEAVMEGVTLVDSGAETAGRVATELHGQDMLSGKDAGGGIRYFVTDSTEGFSELASRFMGAEVGGMVKQIALE